MTAVPPPDPGSGEPGLRRVGRVTGTPLSGTILIVLNLATLFFTVFAWFMIPSGPGDTNHIEGAWFTAFAGTVLALVTALLTAVPVLVGWLGKRWFVVPVVLFVVATARWVYIDAEYPEPPGPYGYGFGQALQ